MDANDREQIKVALIFGGSIWAFGLIGIAISEPDILVAAIITPPMLLLLIFILVKVRKIFR